MQVFFDCYDSGPSIKDIRSQGFVQCGQRGFFRCRRPHILVQKTRIFRNLCCARTDRGEGGGVNFAILCGRLLWTAPSRYSWSWN